jgi:hypothetical protein
LFDASLNSEPIMLGVKLGVVFGITMQQSAVAEMYPLPTNLSLTVTSRQAEQLRPFAL